MVAPRSHAPGEPEWRLHDAVWRQEQWLKAHPEDVIKHAQTANRWGTWYECIRDGKQIAEANDLGRLLDRLESDFK